MSSPEILQTERLDLKVLELESTNSSNKGWRLQWTSAVSALLLRLETLLTRLQWRLLLTCRRMALLCQGEAGMQSPLLGGAAAVARYWAGA